MAARERPGVDDLEVLDGSGRSTPAVERDRHDTCAMDSTTILERSRETSSTATAFGALADPARLAVLGALGRGATCVCELSPGLGMAPNLLSYHLRVLREAGLVEGTRRGRRVDYRVRPMALQELAVELVRLAVGGGEDAR
jgi:ArsR family transcriptional regulator